jgi:hypothetical protein
MPPLETDTSISMVAAEGQITPEPEDTPKDSFGSRLPTPLAFLLATTPVGGLSAYEVFERDFLTAPNTISMEEESDLASLSFSSDIDEFATERTSAVNEADAANRTRLEILAREYVNKQLSAEERARLEIVTQKVRRLIPRVTIEDFEALQHIAERLQAIETDDASRRRRLGIA